MEWAFSHVSTFSSVTLVYLCLYVYVLCVYVMTCLLIYLVYHICDLLICVHSLEAMLSIRISL